MAIKRRRAIIGALLVLSLVGCSAASVDFNKDVTKPASTQNWTVITSDDLNIESRLSVLKYNKTGTCVLLAERGGTVSIIAVSDTLCSQ